MRRPTIFGTPDRTYRKPLPCSNVMGQGCYFKPHPIAFLAYFSGHERGGS